MSQSRANSEAQISGHASFDAIRYAQLWEDADVLLLGLGEQRNATLVSICSAGDNALAMLTLDPARVVAIDLSQAQIACLSIRIAAYKVLNHAELLELLGARPSAQRGELLDRVARNLEPQDQSFWAERRADVEKYGLGGVGKFENYFRIFRRYLLPLAQSRKTIREVFVSKEEPARQAFFEKDWNNWRWRLLLKFFFSNFVMGRLGRDPAFFAHVEGSLADHVGTRIKHAAVDLDPSKNPYLHWILRGTHSRAGPVLPESKQGSGTLRGRASEPDNRDHLSWKRSGDVLPLPWREEHFETIRSRLDRLDVRHGSLEAFVATGEKADGFNLSDIFEYMDEEVFGEVYRSILDATNPAARLVYWNMMVPRRAPKSFAGRIRMLSEVEQAGKAMDKAFFYSDFVVEEVR